MRLLKYSGKCGCFFCKEIFDPKEIVGWVDIGLHGDNLGTAICPYCGMDSVLPEADGIIITDELLEKMKKRFFF